jgi:CheY-like chemotaxis protein
MSAEASAPAGGPDVQDPPARGRVLLAEDDETNQLYAVSLLERDGWDVDLAKTGHEVITLATAGEYDVILMDCNMPELSGYDAATALRKQEGSSHHTPIIALTAYDTKAERDSCMAAGMDGYVVKPFELATLRVEIDLVCVPRPEPVPPGLDPAPAQAESPLDESRLGALPGTVGARLVGLFITSSRQRLAELSAAERSGDTSAARKLTHTLMGASATIGATLMTAACGDLGAALRGTDTDAVAAAHAELEMAFGLTEPALRKYEGEVSDGEHDHS